ncbi:hypothetical protein HWV62_25464 [Athelia sp. TMB]|nr:hypothetical protein HWV62_25464 [Athelia sp. TMB]
MALLSKPLPLLALPPPTRAQLLALLAAALLLRAAPARLLAKLRAVAGRKPRLTQEQLAQALQQIYETDADGTRRLLVPYEDKFVAKIAVRPTPEAKLQADAAHFPPLTGTAAAKPAIDASFARQLRAILFRIAIPGVRSKEAGVVALHSCFLVLRTVLSIAVARLDGRIVRDLVNADGKGFLKGLGLWFLLAVPSTYTNSMIKHLQSTLALRLRSRLTRYIHDLYFSAAPDLRYYRIAHEGGLDGVDQYITADVESWAASLAGLYGNLLKPALDILLFTTQLSRALGARGTVLLFLNYYATASILKAVTPAFGRLAAVEARLEGEYRAGMGRVGREGEEIAFYNGGARERDILTRAYLRLIKHVNSIYKIRIAYEWTEDYVIKYMWSAAGYGLIAVPLLFTRTKRAMGVQTDTPSPSSSSSTEPAPRPDNAVAHRTETYISNRRLLISLADAGGRLMYAYKDLLELAGLTARLYALLAALHALPALPASAGGDGVRLQGVDVGVPLNALEKARALENSALEDNALENSALEKGTWEEGEGRRQVLVRDLTLALAPGEHLMITGSNGVGKTAVARVLAGLWAAQGPSPSLSRPSPFPNNEPSVRVVPQRAYMVAGSLLAQVIYPHTYEDFVRSGRTLAELQGILEDVFLGYLPAREGGWAARKEWRDVLSGGEKQRMGLARVFYHRPRFAVLDECTSAVSSDVEGKMYERAKALGITLITISLRPSLSKYHTHLLTLSGAGDGGWTLQRVGTAEERMGIDREIASLEGRLAEVEEWERRVKELDAQLGAQEAEPVAE